ncbi:MAG: OadG family protein [Myxococcales bacterium]|jgi:hypothetical protein|nr:OadG family protein [Myxococcales bacterium]
MNLVHQLLGLLNTATPQIPDSNLDATPIPKLASRTIGNGLTWGEAFQFLAVGLLIVFITLIALWIICELMGLFFKWLDGKTRKKQMAAAAPGKALPAESTGSTSMLASSAATPLLEEAIPPAVFVAAAQAIMGSTPHRVVSVQKLAPGVSAQSMSASQDIPLAAIAAAVAAVLGQTPHRILSVRPIETNWAQEGRREQLSPLSRP